jgi:hypothetical protein
MIDSFIHSFARVGDNNSKTTHIIMFFGSDRVKGINYTTISTKNSNEIK